MEAKNLRPLSSKEARAVTAELPVWTRSTAELDAWEPSRLHAEVVRTIGCEKKFSVELAQRLDDLFLVKILQLLQTSHATAADYRALDLLIGAIASDEVQGELEAMPEHYGARWKALGDLRSVSLKLRDFRQATAERTHVSQHVWERVADAVLTTRDAEASWSWRELAKVVADAPEGPKSKGGISQLLTSMQAKGWLEAIARGRNKFFFAGPKISESAAWRKRNGTLHARVSPAVVVMPDRERPPERAVAKAVLEFQQASALLLTPQEKLWAHEPAGVIVQSNRPRKGTVSRVGTPKNRPEGKGKVPA